MPGVFLRRPLSIYSAGQSKLEFFYRIVGEGTKNLSQLQPGEYIDVLGALGSGYDIGSAKNMEPLLIAGGTGIASLHFLAARMKKPGILFYGAKSKKDILCIENFKKMGWEIKAATEDGSYGYKGFVTNCLNEYLLDNSLKKRIVYTCGPHPMMQKVAEIAKQHNLSGYASLEEMMACGVGNCQGCAVKVADTFKMACKDGPVFPINDIEW